MAFLSLVQYLLRGAYGRDNKTNDRVLQDYEVRL